MSEAKNIEKIYDDTFNYLLQICWELVKKRKFIKIDKIFNIARRELRVDSSIILKCLKKLQDDLIIRPDTRLMRFELLLNDTRRELYSIISLNPGISFNQIKVRLGRGTKILLWHLNILKEFGCIWSTSFDSRSKAFFTKEFSEENWTKDGLYIMHICHNMKVKKILDYLLVHDSASLPEMSTILELSRQAIEYQLKKLIERKIISFFIDESKKLKMYYLDSLKKDLYLQIKENVFIRFASTSKID
ncbi:MAG: hypothetical protein ACTSRA_02500 [Promethearchaeota archaeon]